MSFGALRLVVGHALRVGCKNTRHSTTWLGKSVSLTSSLAGSRSMWSVSKSLRSCLSTSSFYNKSAVQSLHSTGDKDLVEFLKDEIKVEKENEKSSGKSPKIKGFEITKAEGPNVVLTRKSENETVTIKFNVNNTIEDSMFGMDGQQQEQPDQPDSEMVSKPAFVVEINKGGDQTLVIHCIFPPSDEGQHPEQADHQEHYEDLIEIQDVALLSKSQEWNEDVYSLSGSVMDGNLYDMLLKLMEERGIDAVFLDELIDWSTSYEHKKYIDLLEKLKDFVSAK